MLQRLKCINANALKFIAAFSMFIDHMGYMLFPNSLTFRMIGRLAMPIFAFFIAEGCHYTKNKYKHFALLFALALACQAVYFVFDPTATLFSILFTFSFSTLMIYALQYLKSCIFAHKKVQTAIAAFVFAGAVGFTYAFCHFFHVDYGFWGSMLPVFAALPDFRKWGNKPDLLKKAETLPVRVAFFGVGILTMVFSLLPIALPSVKPALWLHLLVLPLLLLYSGKKGKLRTKYFFYIFYPAHLALLEGIFMLVYYL